MIKKGSSAIVVCCILLLAASLQRSGPLTGCAQISAPTGGPRDSLPPVLTTAKPGLNSVNVTGNRITLNFNEYIEVKEAQTNVLVSPLPKNSPVIDYRLRTVTVRLRDSLLPNTTYSINFGNAIVDINESNPLKDFTFVFSTGPVIDTFALSGKVVLAENGKTDSTITAMLYRNGSDTLVEKTRPDYISRLNGEGAFTFRNLPGGSYKLYALKDSDGSKTYNNKTELFAFADAPVTVSANTPEALLLAYAEEKDSRSGSGGDKTGDKERRLKYTTSLTAAAHDLDSNITISFNKPLTGYADSLIRLTDTSYQPITGAVITQDTGRKIITIRHSWPEGTDFRLLLHKDIAAAADTKLGRFDTLRFTTKKESDYGNLLLRINNSDTGKHIVLQFVQGDEVVLSAPVTGAVWSQKRFKPGEYDLRLLYDANRNGKWDAGSYSNKRQPEKVIVLPRKISIRPNWDNERDINL